MLPGTGFGPGRRCQSARIEMPENALCRSAPLSHPGVIVPECSVTILACRCSVLCCLFAPRQSHFPGVAVPLDLV